MTDELVLETPKELPVPIRINQFVELKKDQTVLELPVVDVPYYVVAQEGLFLRKHNVLGEATLKVTTMPKSIGKMGNAVGWHHWAAPPIPPELCAQIVDFFRRIWDKHKAEAEVLLTARCETNPETGLYVIKEWRVFVPTQKVSGGAVQSVFEPTHIAKGHLIVGTMHSHCNFSAFHSGIDTADADKMDGVHFTIGHVDKDTPEVVSMVATNGVRVTYKPEDLADFSKLDSAKAPEWWDNYVIPSNDLQSTHKPVGFENFKKYEPPTRSYTSGYQNGGGQQHVGRGTYPYGYGGWDGDYDGAWEEYWEWKERKRKEDEAKADTNKSNLPAVRDAINQTVTLRELIERQEKAEEERKTKNDSVLPKIPYQGDNKGDWTQRQKCVHGKADTEKCDDCPGLTFITDPKDPRLAKTDEQISNEEWKRLVNEEKYWEEQISPHARNLIFDADVLSDDDFLEMTSPKIEADIEWMKSLLISKIIAITNALEPLGVSIDYSVSDEKPTIRNQRLRRKQRKEAKRERKSSRGNSKSN